jgi:hypothetical protein
MRDSNDERINSVLDGLTSLIVHHSRMLAREQYAPMQSPDGSDELIEDSKKWIAELRSIRERFENLVTGVIP